MAATLVRCDETDSAASYTSTCRLHDVPEFSAPAGCTVSGRRTPAKRNRQSKAADEAAKDWVAKNADMTALTSVIGDFAWLEFADR